MAMKKQASNKLRVMQKALERATLEVSIIDRQKNKEIRQRTKVVDILQTHKITLNGWLVWCSVHKRKWLGDIRNQVGNWWFQDKVGKYERIRKMFTSRSGQKIAEVEKKKNFFSNMRKTRNNIYSIDFIVYSNENIHHN